MSTPGRTKTELGTAYFATARHFERMAKLFASPKSKSPPYLSRATLQAFEKASRVELHAIDDALKKILTRLN